MKVLSEVVTIDSDTLHDLLSVSVLLDVSRKSQNNKCVRAEELNAAVRETGT